MLGFRPLQIKKLLDDDHESDDLDTDMTVADVFVDNGKARADGHDQRRAVRVVQKPANGEVSPVRFPSVTQDWDAAAEHYEIQRQKKQQQEAGLAVKKLGAIAEEPQGGYGSTSPVDIGDWSNYTPNRTHRRDIPVSSVEKDDEIPVSPSQPPRQSSTREFSRELNGGDSSAPQGHRMGSQELGDSPRSSRAATPKKPTPTRRDSAHSRGSTTRSGTGDARDFDSPALQLRHEHTNSVSPQKKPAPEVAKPNTISLDEESRSEDESDSSDEIPEKNDKDKADKDGDIAMGEDSTPNKKQSPVAAKQRATAVEIPASSAATDSQLRKRKNSADHTSPHKEPRLDRTTPPAAVNGDKRLNNLSPGTPRFSPSGRRLGGTESFTGVARRLSFSERPSEPPSHGLGLGITRSPPKKPSVLVDLSQNSTQSGGDVPQSTPIPTSSAPTARQGSVTQNISTPANVQNPADKLKNLHSALRKDASVERNSVRRSVSFAGDDDVHITASQPAPTSTPMETAKPSETGPASEKRRSSGSMVFPPGVSMERIAQLEREAEEKIERRKNERAEFEEKIKAVEKDKTKSEYAKKLKMAYKTWESILTNEKNGRKNRAESAARLENELKKQRAEIKKMENSMNKPSSQDKATKSQTQKPVNSQTDTKKDTPGSSKRSSTPTTDETKKSQSSRKSPKPQQDAKDDTSASPKPTSAPATDRNTKSPVSISGWNAINAKSPTSTAKSAAPTASGTAFKSTPKEPTARTVATRTLSGSKASKPASIQSQNSTASDEIDLPAMKVQARTNANPAKKAAQEPVEVSSSSESEEETSSDDFSESESESESSDDETKNKMPSAATSSSTKSPQKASKAASPPSAQRTTKSPAPSSQQTSQAPSQGESWRWPRASQASSTRLSLKSIKGEVASQAQAQAAAKAAPQKRGQPRKDLFSPPDSDSDETESESESESSSSSDDSDSESDNNKGSGANGSKRSNSPGSVADAGDIMSSGQVQKLRPARLGGRA